MIRTLPAALIAMLPLSAQAQGTDAADLICLSVGGDGIWTQLAIFGSDHSALVVAVPPEGVEEPMESYAVTMPETAFADMVAILRPGLDDLPPPPDAEACADDTLGPVTFTLSQQGQDILRYAAPCPTPEVLALNDALIAATGDPNGEAYREWTGRIVPAMRDICRTMP